MQLAFLSSSIAHIEKAARLGLEEGLVRGWQVLAPLIHPTPR